MQGRLQGPTGLLVTGNLFQFRKDPLGFLQKAATEYGDIIPLRFGPRRVYMLTNPEYIKQVLVSKQAYFIKAKGLRTAKAVVGEGILTSEGKKHVRQRRLMQPAFHRERIADYADTIVGYAERLAAGWQDGEERNILEDMMEMTLAIITRTMFSIDIYDKSSLHQGIHDIGHAIEVGMKYVSRKASSFIDLPETIPTRRNKEWQESSDTLNDVIYSIISERRQSVKQEKGDLLSMLMAARDEDDGTGMTDQQLRDEVMTIFLAGHETTANTLTWIWYLLSQNPEAEQKLWNELDSVLQGRPPKAEDLKHLPYTNHVIWEAMRLYPAAWAVNREVADEVEIGGYNFQPGETVLMSQYVMHRNPKYYDNPDGFVPERFAGDLLKRIPQYAYFPFGGGPRMCIGNNFALMEAGLVVAAIAQKYKLRLAENHPPVVPEPLITLRPKNGIRMTVQAR